MDYISRVLTKKAVRSHSTPTMPLAPLRAPPAFAAPEEHAEMQASTPASFEKMPPALIAELSDVVVKLQPVPQVLCDGEAPDSLVLVGRVWVTEESLSFLPNTSEYAGFQVSYPLIALHAVSRSVPEDVATSVPKGDAYHADACIYCQLDDHPEQDNEEDEENVCELWLVVRDAETRTLQC